MSDATTADLWVIRRGTEFWYDGDLDSGFPSGWVPDMQAATAFRDKDDAATVVRSIHGGEVVSAGAVLARGAKSPVVFLFTAWMNAHAEAKRTGEEADRAYDRRNKAEEAATAAAQPFARAVLDAAGLAWTTRKGRSVMVRMGGQVLRVSEGNEEYRNEFAVEVVPVVELAAG